MSTPDEPSTEERRAETRRQWDERLRAVLRTEWRSSREIAAELGANHDTVMGRLKDMLQRGLVEREVVRGNTPPPPPTAKKRRRVQKHRSLWISRFRLIDG